MGKSFSKNVMGLALATVMVSSAAQAQTAPAAPATSEAQASSFRDKVGLTLGSDFFGPSVSDPQAFKPNVDTGARDKAEGIHTENYVKADYKLGAGYTASAVGAFAHYAGGAGAKMLDPQLRIGNGSLYKNGAFNYGAQARVYMGVTEGSRNANMLSNVRLYNNFGFEPAGSRLTFDLTTYIRPYFYSDTTPTNTVIRYYAGPEVGYRLASNLKAWLLFEYIGDSKSGAGAFNLAPSTDLEPGLTWDVTPQLSFTPYLDIKTSNRVALDTTTFNASVSFKAL